MKSILIIGMGKFGQHLCRKLLELNNEIMIIDQHEEQIRDFFTEVTSARIGDCTNPDVLQALGLNNFDAVVVAIGENFQNSLEITNMVKEFGAKYVISLSSRDIQTKFLLKNGADEVVYPEKDLAYNLAARCSANHVFDYIELDEEYSIYEVPILRSWVGKSIQELGIRANYEINIIGVVSNGEINIMPPIDYKFREGDHVKILADGEASDRLFKQLDKGM